jgi:hypothetical protein
MITASMNSADIYRLRFLVFNIYIYIYIHSEPSNFERFDVRTTWNSNKKFEENPVLKLEQKLESRTTWKSNCLQERIVFEVRGSTVYIFRNSVPLIAFSFLSIPSHTAAYNVDYTQTTHYLIIKSHKPHLSVLHLGLQQTETRLHSLR